MSFNFFFMINKVQMSYTMKGNVLLSHHTPNNNFLISKAKITEQFSCKSMGISSLEIELIENINLIKGRYSQNKDSKKQTIYVD